MIDGVPSLVDFVIPAKAGNSVFFVQNEDARFRGHDDLK